MAHYLKIFYPRVAEDGAIELLEEGQGYHNREKGVVTDMPSYEVSAVRNGQSSSGRRTGSEALSTKPEEVSLSMMSGTEEEVHEAKKHLFLYEEDMKSMPRVATFLKNLQNFAHHATYPTEREVQESKKQPKKAKLGIILGVYLPTIQHIFGVLMFVRLAWIVGSMGVIQSFSMVFMCCLATFLTSISMSAIATNGAVQAGGSYFMISRNLGPECGAAVGICFYLANTFATDLYLLGSLEILLQYMAPSLAYFGDIHHNPWNNFRLYGTIGVILLTLVVAVGVKFVQYFAPFALTCVIVSILACFVGAFQASESTRDVWICLLGERLLVPPDYLGNGTFTNELEKIQSWCHGNVTGDVWQRYCDVSNMSSACDSYYTENQPPMYRAGIPGVASGVITDNLFSTYMSKGEVSPGVEGNADRGEVLQDYTTTFVSLCAIYFPSVTGIMTGSNMSGDLKDPQKSIPVGTIAATLTTSFVYLSFTLLFGATGDGFLLRDKYGHSQNGELFAASMAWPSHWVVLVGAFCSTLGAALQCITSAPRLLQAIARDDIIPFLNVFKVVTKKGEPLRALVLTALIAECGILIASLDYVAPVIDVCFLMCYGFVNLTVALQTLLKTPSWRPRFKYYHWSLAFLGVALNLALSIIAGWYYALSAFLLALFIYKYVEYKGGEKEWGDGITGLSMSAAQRALLNLEEGDVHTKNWRPQILVLMKLQDDLEPKYRRMFSFARQLKAGKGLTVVASVMEGEYLEMRDTALQAKQKIQNILEEEKVKGFAKVMVTRDIVEGINIFIQTVGLGGMKHNTVVVGWPYGWKEHHEERHWKVFLDAIRVVTARELALLVPKGIDNFPSSKDKLTGTIDVWWIVHDGGMLILLSFLLRQHKTWKNCQVRIFTVAQMTDNSIQLKKDLEHFLYQLRITAEVYIEEMYDNDISAYTVERTLDMEKRAEILKELKLKRKGTDLSMPQRDTSSPQAATGTAVHYQRSPRKRSSLRLKKPELKSIQEIVDASHQKSAETLPPGRKSSRVSLSSPQNGDIEHVTQSSCDQQRDEMEESDGEEESHPDVHFTFSASEARARLAKDTEETRKGLEICEGKLMRMHTALKLNETIKKKSAEAELVIINFPAPPSKLAAEENYMYYLEALTEGLPRVLMVRGTGREVVTIYS